MKHVQACILLLLLPLNLFAQDSLIAYYPFNGNSNDESGNGNDLTPMGGIILSTDRFGNDSSAYAFDGTDDHLLLEDTSAMQFGPEDLTVCVWIRTSQYGRVISRGECNGSAGWQITLDGPGRITVAMQFPTNSGAHYFISTDSGYNDDQWHFVAFTRDNGNIQIFGDGLVDGGTGTFSNSMTNPNIQLAIGRNMESSPCDQYFSGLIDDIRFYARALSATEVDSLYHEGGWPLPAQGLVAHYPFNGNANDESGNGNDGTVLGAALATDRFGNINKAYTFDGTDDYISVNEDSTLEFGTGDFTVCAWILTTSTRGERVVTKGECFNTGWSLGHNSRIQTSLQAPPHGPIYPASDNVNYADGRWHFILFKRQSGAVSIYGDGNLDGDTASFPYNLTNVSEHMTIGRFRESGGACENAFHTGKIDDIRIYNRALSEIEIQQLYHESGWPLQSSWQSPLIAFDACGDTLVGAFGQDPLATDCIDSNTCEQDLPPSPPAGAFDIRFILPCEPSPTASLCDIRSDPPEEVLWRLKLQACSYPLTLQWDTSALPTGRIYMRDLYGGILVNIDMKTQDRVVLNNPVITELLIEKSVEACRVILTHGGWNMVSLPLNMASRHYLEVFPDAISHPYLFDSNGYTLDDTLDPGVGYWIKFNGMHIYNFCGWTVVDKKVEVNPGWNMIGPFEDTVIVSEITSDPGGIVISSFYRYDPPYAISVTLFPGKGYWVKASQGGTLHFSAGGSQLAARSDGEFVVEAPPSPPEDVIVEKNIPLVFSLAQNHPNPFNPSTTITYQLPERNHVKLTILDVLGRELAVLVDESQDVGRKSITWDGGNTASGVYFYRIEAGAFRQTRKMLLLK